MKKNNQKKLSLDDLLLWAEDFSWILFTSFCLIIFGWMFYTVATEIGRAEAQRNLIRAKNKKIIRCIEEKYQVKHLIFNSFEDKYGYRFSVSDPGECGRAGVDGDSPREQ